jgi:hypothetical protein
LPLIRSGRNGDAALFVNGQIAVVEWRNSIKWRNVPLDHNLGVGGGRDWKHQNAEKRQYAKHALVPLNKMTSLEQQTLAREVILAWEVAIY